MRTLSPGSMELVRGRMIEVNGDDVTDLQGLLQMAVTPSSVVDPRTIAGPSWKVADDVRMIGKSTLRPALNVTAADPGKYTLWVKWSDNPEAPILPVGQFKVAG